MGRLKKYNTDEEKRIAQNKWANEYYWRNKEKIDKQMKERYWRKKTNGNSKTMD